MQRIKINDQIIVLKGKDRGKTGKVKRLNFNKRQVWVEGINQVKKTRKPTQENPQGGILFIDAPMNISNVALISPKTKKASRVRIEKREDKNIRVAVACGTALEGGKA
ncbi:MAG: 50S ribosomal protein L24 [Halobacteriovoraceae bacterium]|nr:50S ribosomal protein L24 [Halobacteriovoraceae bacterium]